MELPYVPTVFHALDPLQRLELGTRAPWPWLTSGEDRLRVTVRNGATGVRVDLSGRFLTMAGVVTPVVYAVTPATDLTATSQEFALGDGWLLNLTARIGAGTPQVGETFVTVEIIRGRSTTAIVLGTILAHFITAAAPAAWPGSWLQSTADAPGAIRTVVGTAPAAGAEFSIVVPTGERWRLQSLIVQLSTDATVANREVALLIRIGGVTSILAPSGLNHAASTVRAYTWFLGAPRGAGATSLNVISPLPAIVLPAGAEITASTTNLQTADAYGTPAVSFEQTLES